MNVTAIMPTANRHEFIERACELFLAQTLTDAHLLILDNGREPVFNLIPSFERISYVCADPGKTLGELRNIACGLVSVPLVANWDDDDYYHPQRLEEQAAAIGDADICGYGRIAFAGNGERWIYTAPPDSLLGNSLMFRRDFWQRHPFFAMRDCDEQFVRNTRRARVVRMDGVGRCIASIHPGNSSPRRTDAPGWEQVFERPEN